MTPFERRKSKIEHVESWRFLVPSSVDGEDAYLVDLEEYDGNGKCPCMNFAFRLEPDLARAENSGYSQCKHIRAALDHVLNPEELRDLVMSKLLRTGRFELTIVASAPFTIPTPEIPRVVPEETQA